MHRRARRLSSLSGPGRSGLGPQQEVRALEHRAQHQAQARARVAVGGRLGQRPQALIRDEHGGKYVYSFLIPIERGKLFKMYSIRGGEIVVMALHGHVYYPDWQPDGGKNPGPFEAITKEGGELVKKGDELGDAEKAKYEDIFFESVMEWRNPPSGSPVDWAKHFMFGTKTSTYLMKAAQPDWLERLAALIDKIERGEVIMSEKMKTDLQVNYLQFE